MESGHQKRNVKSLEWHEDYNTPQFNNDVALITISEPFDISDPHVQPIEMFKFDDPEIAAETICNSTGWGLTFGGGIYLPNHLQWIQIPLHSREQCEETFEGAMITDGMICAGGPGASTCNVFFFIFIKSEKSVVIIILFCLFLGRFWWTFSMSRL